MTMADLQARRKWLVERARTMRTNPTDAERKLWLMLRQRRLGDLRWRRQEIIDDKYIVDFICFEHRLIVEADGGQHADNRLDDARDAYLKAQGFTVLRFWNNDVLTNLDGVGEAVFAAIGIHTAQTRGDPTPNPLPQGERALESVSHV